MGISMHAGGMMGAAAVAVTLALGAGAARAATFTTIQAPHRGEAGHAEILGHTFGEGFSAVGGTLDFQSTAFYAQRVDDDLDHIFPAGVYDAQVVAAFAGLGQTFGYRAGASGGAFTELFSVSGSDYGVSGAQHAVDLSAGPFRWARTGPNGEVTSANGDNPDGLDHLITYVITGADLEGPVTMLFFEDLFGSRADDDFQDLVVKLTSNVAPLPAAVWGGLALLGAVGLHRRRRLA